MSCQTGLSAVIPFMRLQHYTQFFDTVLQLQLFGVMFCDKLLFVKQNEGTKMSRMVYHPLFIVFSLLT